jgi:exodeoxyribonuclease-1
MQDFSFFWHDYETFGVSPRVDRPAQFAGIRTDADLNEIGQAVMLYCQPAPDYLPQPQACLLTGILPQTCQAKGVPEYRFAERIEQELARPGTVGVGYNTIRFDDEVTRHLFWRSLIDPYAREWQNQCGRWDLLDVVRCTWALRPEGIEWPLHDDGRPSFKLEHLTAANGLTHEAAHDALSDVRATIDMARLIKSRQPRLWDFCLRLRKKEAVLAEIGVGQPFIHISGMYPVTQGCIGLVWPLAPHPSNKNEIIVWDLAHDPAELFTLSAKDIRQRMYTKAEDLPAGVTRLPIKTIHINKSPMVIGQLKTLTPAVVERWHIDVPQALKHAEVAALHGHSMAGIWPEVFEREASANPVDVDQDLYGGFIGNDDRRLLTRLRSLSPTALAEQLADRQPHFADERLSELLFRYRARNHPGTLSEADMQQWRAHCEQVLVEGVAGGLTLESYTRLLDELSEQVSDDDERSQDILGALYDYAAQIAPE